MRYWSVMILLAAAALTGCNSTTVRTTEQTPVNIDSVQSIPESELLDVGVGIFDPNVDALGGEAENVFPEIRRAEARYMPNILAMTLQNTGGWGVVRIIPERQSEMDVWVDGQILQSDGEFLKVRITVEDASGRHWFTRIYEEEASKYSYDQQLRQNSEPFQGLYNRVANDMQAYRRTLPPGEAAKLRTISELKFARRFSPEAFSDYLETDGRGRYTVKRLPAESDPLLQQVRRIRERDNLFVDTLQDHYIAFSRQMQTSYHQWRHESYRESLALRQTRAEATGRIVGGVLAGMAGIAAAVLAGSSGNPGVRSMGTVAGVAGVGAGAMLVKSGLDKRAEAKMHAEALKEISASMDASVQPHTVMLEDRTVTLTGTVEQQYTQWREILREIYETETGGALPAQPAAQSP